MSVREAKEFMSSDSISAGMIPKLKACVDAVEGGVERAHIIDGRREHAILLELFADEGIGTMFTKD
jgi:acetylglutamate kinase